MELFSWSFFAFAVPATLFAGISKGGFGSGASFVSASILALVLSPGQALGIMLPLLMLIDAASLPAYWKRWKTSDAWLLILGSVPGIALGAVLYRLANDDIIRLLIGALCLGFVGVQILQSRGSSVTERPGLPRWSGYLAGAVAGFTSFISHAGGPVAAVYLLRQGHDKNTYQATTVIAFWAMNVMKCAMYAWLGMLGLENLAVDLVLAPFAILGTFLGIRAHYWLPQTIFFYITYGLLIATGTKLILDGIT